jgi:acetoin utilization deacetylase AcuC-like enzyme
MKIITDEHCTEYASPGHPERPARISKTLEKLRGQKELSLTWGKPAAFEEAVLLRAHTAEHLKRLEESGDFDADTPNLPNILARARASVGAGLGALKAVRAGDTVFSLMRPPGHHATRNRAMGFCYLSNVAIAVLEAQATGMKRVAVYDFDVHHGNGTAMIFDGDASVFTFSMHQQHNYPFFKPRSDLDIGLEDGAGDERYLTALAGALPRVVDARPDLLVYLAGADPFQGDQLGGLRLTQAGLAERDRLVFDAARLGGLPLVVVLAGGYALDVRDTVDIHVATIAALAS